ncbi:MAG TPA: 5-formyltetrahydrofolate cyclo-ligase [Actinobacteria bacterium]|nr:5-formyltetrahydrofolate cyclo-ligase [Actinomycetota bacterium]
MGNAETKREKEALRREILTKRDSQTAEEMARKSSKIKERLWGLPEFKRAKVVMFYVSFGSEVQTKEMIKEVLATGKKVIVPAPQPKKRELLCSLIGDYRDLEPGTYGILEPKKSKIRPVDVSHLDLIIVPGCVFDLRGYRLGYGKGYYDRFLKKTTPKTTLVGLAYELQIVKEIPATAHDVPVHKIITENRVIDTTASSQCIE